MLSLRKLSPEAYQAEGPVIHLGQAECDFLDLAVAQSERRRSRILCHKDVNAALHEMVVKYSPATYVRVNRHAQDESLYVVDGFLDLVFFDDNQQITDLVRLGHQHSGLAFYARVPAGRWHTVLMRSDTLLFEATPGPFVPAHTEYARWCPPESDVVKVKEWTTALKQRVEVFAKGRLRDPGIVERTAPLVYTITDPIPTLTIADGQMLRNQVAEDGLDRVRICTHRAPDARLQQMLMAFSEKSYIRPSRHMDKDESLFVLNGFCTYVFFSNTGETTKAVPLGPLGSGRSCYCRVPINSWHVLLLESDVLVLETTSGPFRKEFTEFAPWSPERDAGAFITVLKEKAGVVS